MLEKRAVRLTKLTPKKGREACPWFTRLTPKKGVGVGLRVCCPPWRRISTPSRRPPASSGPQNVPAAGAWSAGTSRGADEHRGQAEVACNAFDGLSEGLRGASEG